MERPVTGVCAAHPEIRAISTCDRCGEFACAFCVDGDERTHACGHRKRIQTLLTRVPPMWMRIALRVIYLLCLFSIFVGIAMCFSTFVTSRGQLFASMQQHATEELEVWRPAVPKVGLILVAIGTVLAGTAASILDGSGVRIWKSPAFFRGAGWSLALGAAGFALLRPQTIWSLFAWIPLVGLLLSRPPGSMRKFLDDFRRFQLNDGRSLTEKVAALEQWIRRPISQRSRMYLLMLLSEWALSAGEVQLATSVLDALEHSRRMPRLLHPGYAAARLHIAALTGTLETARAWKKLAEHRPLLLVLLRRIPPRELTVIVADAIVEAREERFSDLLATHDARVTEVLRRDGLLNDSSHDQLLHLKAFALSQTGADPAMVSAVLKARRLPGERDLIERKLAAFPLTNRESAPTT